MRTEEEEEEEEGAVAPEGGPDGLANIHEALSANREGRLLSAWTAQRYLFRSCSESKHKEKLFTPVNAGRLNAAAAISEVRR
ncbi:hypothetical protein NDU88_006482 [Pleurodeles waltl]|uniref:Uncharacterized protein n=1 Tax=Pleurodeles waltl TaxID=8319 RepID=A0AAV7TYN3_PLEWA|nr:hypothetical protein NDU88_006482 [Pleurodeles waltl]